MTAYRQPCGHTAARIIPTRAGDLYECQTCGIVTVAETPETIARRERATIAYRAAYNAALEAQRITLRVRPCDGTRADPQHTPRYLPEPEPEPEPTPGPFDDPRSPSFRSWRLARERRRP